MLEWEWYKDNNTKAVFLHLLLIATYKPIIYKGRELKAGQVAITVKELSEEISQTISQTRTALRHLTKTGEIEIETTNQFSVITLVNYGLYQFSEKKMTNEIANENADTSQTKSQTNAHSDDKPKNNNFNNNNNINNLCVDKDSVVNTKGSHEKSSQDITNKDYSFIKDAKIRRRLEEYQERIRRHRERVQGGQT